MPTIEEKLFYYSKWLFLFVVLLSIALLSMFLVPQLLQSETTQPEQTQTEVTITNINTGETISATEDFELTLNNVSKDVTYTITNPTAQIPIVSGQYRVNLSHKYYTVETETITVSNQNTETLEFRVVPNTLTLEFADPVTGKIMYNNETYSLKNEESFTIPQQIETGDQTYTVDIEGYQTQTNTIEVTGTTTVTIQTE